MSDDEADEVDECFSSIITRGLLKSFGFKEEYERTRESYLTYGGTLSEYSDDEAG